MHSSRASTPAIVLRRASISAVTRDLLTRAICAQIFRAQLSREISSGWPSSGCGDRNRFRVDFFYPARSFPVVHIRILEDAHPISSGRLHEIAKFSKSLSGLTGNPTMNDVRSATPESCAHALQQFKNASPFEPALHQRQNISAGVLAA